MIELLHTDTLERAKDKLSEQTTDFAFKIKNVILEDALGCVCAGDVIAQENIPPFRRSTVDGFAIRARDSYGAGEANPMFYQVMGQISIEEYTDLFVTAGKAVQVQTGSMVPDGADAVLMVEYTETYAAKKIIGYKAVSEGENVAQIGEDITAGSCILKKGRKISVGDIGTLAALGVQSVDVFEPPVVTVISTGDELVDIDGVPDGSKIRDINTYALAAQARSFGMCVRKMVRTKDNEPEILAAVKEALAESDMILLSGGSSKGSRDYTKKVLESVTGNVFTHGISIKPGKPTILAYDHVHKTVIAGLPGHPMAAVLMFRLVAADWYYRKTEQKKQMPYYAKIGENVSSNQGRETCLLVRLLGTEEGYVAMPIHAKSGSISSLGRADGYVLIPRNQEGLKKDAYVWVEVF